MAELIPLFYHDVEFEEFPELMMISARKRFPSETSLYAKVLQNNFQSKIDAQIEVDNAALEEAIAWDIEMEAENQLALHEPSIVDSDSDDDEDMETDDNDCSDEEMIIGDDDKSMDYDPSTESEDEADQDE